MQTLDNLEPESWKLDSLTSIAWNHNTRIVSLASLPILKPYVEAYLGKKGHKWSIHHVYMSLAHHLKTKILKPHEIIIPSHLVGTSTGFFYCYQMSAPTDNISITRALSDAFWWIDFWQKSIEKASVESSEVSSVVESVPQKVADVIAMDVKPQYDIRNEFKYFANWMIRTIQSKNNREALGGITSMLGGMVELSQDWKIQLSSGGHMLTKRLDEPVQEILAWYIHSFNQNAPQG